VKHGDISGAAAGIWSTGVSLYYLGFGRVPLERSRVLELYEAIRNDDLAIDQIEPEFMELIQQLPGKDAGKRIKMPERRVRGISNFLFPMEK
jgi:[calcium/calmodulin-dependent protein kinase] kinase